MSRKTAREAVVQLTFACANSKQEYEVVLNDFFDEEHLASFAGEEDCIPDIQDEKDMQYVRSLMGLIAEHQPEIDEYIVKYAKGWRIERISKTALAVLRTAICEILYVDDVPAKVAVNEAIEIDKGYDTPETTSFVNGVLGSFVRCEINKEENSDV